MMERLARASSLPLQNADVTAEGSIDTEAVREGPAVLDRAHMRFELVGVNDAQAKELVATYKQRWPLYGSVAVATANTTVEVVAIPG
jgi:hypothetical protein